MAHLGENALYQDNLGDIVSPARDFLMFLPCSSHLSETLLLEREIALREGQGQNSLTHFSFPQTLAHNSRSRSPFPTLWAHLHDRGHTPPN